MAPTRARLGQIGPLAATKRPNINPKCVVTISLTQADQLVAVGTKSGPLGPSDDLQGLQKGHFWPKRALLGAILAQKQFSVMKEGILVVYDFALVFALAPISLMFCPKFLPLPLPSILLYKMGKMGARAKTRAKS